MVRGATSRPSRSNNGSLPPGSNSPRSKYRRCGSVGRSVAAISSCSSLTGSILAVIRMLGGRITKDALPEGGARRLAPDGVVKIALTDDPADNHGQLVSNLRLLTITRVNDD